MRGTRSKSLPDRLDHRLWWRWLCVALVVVFALGSGGLERVHVGVSHDHADLTALEHARGEAHAPGTSTGSDRALSAPCDTCRELKWARQGQAGSGSASLAIAPPDDAADRFILFAEQVRSVASPADIRSRAPPTT